MINFLPLEGEAASDGGASMWIMFAVYAVFIAALSLNLSVPELSGKRKKNRCAKMHKSVTKLQPLAVCAAGSWPLRKTPIR